MRSPRSLTHSSATDAVLRVLPARSAAAACRLILALAIPACSGDGPSPTKPTTPSLTLSLSTPSVTVRGGDQGLLTVVLTRANLSQDVRLTVSDLPAGVTGTFTNPTLPAGSVASTLLLNASREAAPGTYTAIVTASAQGVNAQALPLLLTVTPAPTIALTAKPDSVSIIAGGYASITLDIERRAFTGGVTFELEGAPPGITATFPDSPTTGSLATANFAASSDVLPGVYVFAINGIAAGLPLVNTFVQLTVLPPLVSGFDIAVNPEALLLKQGGADSVMVTIERRNYDAAVTLTAAGLPTGVVAVFNPTTTTGDHATLTLIAGSNVPVGTYALTVFASGEGAATTGANVTLVVEEMPALALLSLPESLAVHAGDSIQGTITLQRTNLPGEVQLAATGAPAGVSITFTANPTTESIVTFKFVVDASVAPGSYVVTIHAIAPGIPSIDVPLTLTIAAPGT